LINSFAPHLYGENVPHDLFDIRDVQFCAKKIVEPVDFAHLHST